MAQDVMFLVIEKVFQLGVPTVMLAFLAWWLKDTTPKVLNNWTNTNIALTKITTHMDTLSERIEKLENAVVKLELMQTKLTEWASKVSS